MTRRTDRRAGKGHHSVLGAQATLGNGGFYIMRVRISRWHENGHDCDRLHTGIDIPREITDPRPHHEHHIEEDVES